MGWLFGLAAGALSPIAEAASQAEFFHAVELDRVAAVRASLQAGVDVNALAPQGQSALMLALREGSAQVTALLLAWPGLAFDVPNAVGETPLMMACLKGDGAAASTLLALGAEVKRLGWTPLHYAASGGHIDLMQRMLAEGAVLDGRAPGGQTPLMMAAGFGSIDAADWLLGRGAQPGLRSDAGRSASDFARSAGRDDLADRLERATRPLSPAKP